ncbi:catalase family peroxidase [Microbulbifer sp. SA54]|uniref:catalase family peroxidase n=1 Tax=Microbulbifer sp. SA54 TaxID=3401577 RepID=UPI003AAC73C4
MNKGGLVYFAKRYLPLAGVVGGLAGAFIYAAGGFGSSVVTAQEFVNLQQGKTIHAGFRRAHAKGFCVSGTFVSDGALQPYTTASVFSGRTTPLIGRFSVAGNDPTAPDLKAPVRSLALSLAVDAGDVWRTAMNTPPVMAVRNPQDFFQQLTALAPDEKTGKRDPKKIQKFFAEHPESKAFTTWAADYRPSGSLATETYHSINAFYLVDGEGKRRAVRWEARPGKAGQEESATSAGDGKDALHQEFFRRLERGPVTFDLVFTLADAEDDENDPSQPWPETRQQLVAGKVIITDAMPQTSGSCNAISFDPLVLPEGMAATGDPILRARSAAYAESYRRRAIEHWRSASQEDS